MTHVTWHHYNKTHVTVVEPYYRYVNAGFAFQRWTRNDNVTCVRHHMQRAMWCSSVLKDKVHSAAHRSLLGALLCPYTASAQSLCPTYPSTHNPSSQEHSSMDPSQKPPTVPVVVGWRRLKRLFDLSRLSSNNQSEKETSGFLYVPATTTDPQPKRNRADSNPHFSYGGSHSGCIYSTTSSGGMTGSTLLA